MSTENNFEYQNTNTFFAQVGGDLEELAAQEINELGGTNVKPAFRGVYFSADQQALYNINYNSRFITRILAPLLTLRCRNTIDLKKSAARIKWDKFLSVDGTFAISSTVINNEGFTNSLFAAQFLKDIIADYFRERRGRRPDVNKDNPDVRFNLFIEKDRGIISLDISGESLHKRGYRVSGGEAPIKETVAAAIVKYSGWNGETELWDPMCGSGTLLAEALIHYCKIPTQYLRKKFGFMNMPEYDSKLWEKVVEESNKNIRPLKPGILKGSDKSEKAISIASANLSNLPGGSAVELKTASFQEIEGFQDGIITTNPPYGMRIGTNEEVKNLLSEFGTYLKHKCNGTSAFVYIGDKELRKYIGLKPSKKFQLSNGVLEGQLLRIDSFKGKYAEMKANKENKEQ